MTQALNPKTNALALSEIIHIILNHRYLIFALTKREIGERYAGQILGTFWTIGHPLVLIGIYVFIFGTVLKIKIGGTIDMPYDFAAYLLAGLIPWLTFQESIQKTTSSIVWNANIVKQVIFPIEVLPIKSVLASIVTEIILFCLLIIYTLIKYHSLPLTYALLPILVSIQVIGMIGLGYVLSAAGVYFRDLKDIIQIFITAVFYLLPILYLPSSFPENLVGVLYLNPLSHMIWSFQDVVFFGRIDHPWSWVIFTGLSFALFLFGYRFFRKLKVMFGNVL